MTDVVKEIWTDILSLSDAAENGYFILSVKDMLCCLSDKEIQQLNLIIEKIGQYRINKGLKPTIKYKKK